METEGLRIQSIDNKWKFRFANFSFPKRTETEILFLSQMEMEFLFQSVSIKPIFRFPFSVSGPNFLVSQITTLSK